MEYPWVERILVAGRPPLMNLPCSHRPLSMGKIQGIRTTLPTAKPVPPGVLSSSSRGDTRVCQKCTRTIKLRLCSHDLPTTCTWDTECRRCAVWVPTERIIQLVRLVHQFKRQRPTRGMYSAIVRFRMHVLSTLRKIKDSYVLRFYFLTVGADRKEVIYLYSIFPTI